MRNVTYVLGATLAVALCGAASTAQAQQPSFEVDWLFFDRTNNTDRGQSIVGPNSRDFSDVEFDAESGFRLRGLVPYGDHEFTASFFQIDGWGTGRRGTLSEPLALDGIATSAAVFGPGETANVLSGFSAIGEAARFFDDTGADTNNEANESEHLLGGSTFGFDYRSRLRSFDFMIKQGRHRSDIRWGIGFRHVDVNEGSLLALNGMLNAVDLNDGALNGDANNDVNGSGAPLNDGLSHVALTQGGGFTRVSGPADGFDGFRVGSGRDTLVIAQAQNSDNRLDGVQVSLDAIIYANDAFSIEAFANSGLYHNTAHGVITETAAATSNDESVYMRTLSSERNVASYVGTAGVRGGVQLTDYIRVHAGYEVIGIAGVALAPEQINGVRTDILGNTVYDLETNGNFVAHGGSLGMEVTW